VGRTLYHFAVEGFRQDPPRLTNTFRADAALRDVLAHLLPADVRESLRPEWEALGEAAAGPLDALARQAEREPPRHVPFDAWGRRIDHIEVSAAWTALHREAARWGLTAIPYEGRLGPYARLHQFALLQLYGPSSAIYSCPLAMTDGAARTLLDHDPGGEATRRAVPHLTSRDPDALWTSGQWMTETSGGSDVSGTETLARRGEDGRWRLRGLKWFTSATTSEMALTLARPEGAPAGSRGLQLFYLEQRLADGSLNGIHIHRLKDKLGTRALPTAELSLEDTIALPIGGVGEGVKRITPLLNTTRLHNAINACGLMARTLQLLRDFARRRQAFGGLLAHKPLHVHTLAALQVEYEAALALTFEAVRLRGRAEAGEATATEAGALRWLTPLAKLMTAKQAVAVCSEGLEGFGGAGYVEDTGLPVLLRNAQVLPIWEGTTNVLAKDALRAAAREEALASWLEMARRRLEPLRCGAVAEMAVELGRRAAALAARLEESAPEAAEAAARDIAQEAARLAAALPLLELAAGGSERAVPGVRRWLSAAAAGAPDLPGDRLLGLPEAVPRGVDN
jgi:alkylation response protein AidB-like acyl-CoA dehydrogenase